MDQRHQGLPHQQHSTFERGRSRSREHPKRTTTTEVMTNFFRVRAKHGVNQGGKWILYKVEIQAVTRKKEVGADGDCVHVFVPKVGRNPFALEETKSTPISRRILLKLQRNLASEGKYFATDGGDRVCAPSPLFTTTKPEPSEGEPTGKPQEDFHVKVTLHCEDDDPSRTQPPHHDYFNPCAKNNL